MLKKCIGGVLLFGAAVALVIGGGMEQEPAVFLPGNSRNVVRLHVIANSDAQLDQMVKLKVRDAILAHMAPKLKHVANSETATAVIVDNQRDIEDVARRVLLLNGITYPVQVQFGQFDFPIKSYGDVVLPAGKYDAVRVMLGEARGSNWWCVLFPPLCFIDANNAVFVHTLNHKEKDGSINEKLEFRWKVIELYQQLGKQS